MRIVYIYRALLTVGGADRVLTEKANYLAEVVGHEVYFVTDSQKGLPPVFPLSPKVKHIDLEIDFFQQYHHGLLLRAYYYFKLMREYKKKVRHTLEVIKPDIVITTLGCDLDFLTDLKDGSKKVGESHVAKHYTRNFHLLEAKGFPYKQIAQYWRRKQERAVSKLDALVVLTQHDADSWKEVKLATIIPNSLPFYPEESSTLEQKRVISVGRLSGEKGFDLLISTWAIVARQHPDWQLHLYGEGELESQLRQLIAHEKVEDSFFIHPPVKNIAEKYLESSVYVMSSHFEGFGMVLIEAMACGVPCVSFNCPHGPADIIRHEEDGLLVEYGNINRLAESLSMLIDNKEMRKKLGKRAKENIARYNAPTVMSQWEELFHNLTRK